jgi:hypothetical protein
MDELKSVLRRQILVAGGLSITLPAWAMPANIRKSSLVIVFSGRVLDPEGGPLAGFEIKPRQGDPVITDADGRFVLTANSIQGPGEQFAYEVRCLESGACRVIGMRTEELPMPLDGVVRISASIPLKDLL